MTVLKAGVQLIATFTALPGQEARVAELLTEYAGHVRAESGNQTFDTFTDAIHSRRFIVIERYEDEKSFVQHLASAHGQAFNAALTERIAEPSSQLTFLKAVGEG